MKTIKSLHEIVENVCAINIIDADVLRQCGARMFEHDPYSLSVVPLSALDELANGQQTSEARKALNYVDALRGDLVRGTVEFDDGRHYLAIGGYTPLGMESPEQRRHMSGTCVPREAGASLLTCAGYMKGLGLDPQIDVVIYSNNVMTRLEAARSGFDARQCYERARHFTGRVSFSSADAVKYAMDPGDSKLAARVANIADNAAYERYHVNPYHVVIEASGVTPLVKDGRRLSPLFGSDGALDKLARNLEQRAALRYLMDDDIQMVALSGVAGGGKTYLSLYAGLMGLRSGRYKHVLVFRPMYAVGGQDMGTLPGDKEDKFSPWQAAIKDNLDELGAQPRDRAEIFIDPLSYIRGRTFNNMLVIVDDAQSLDKEVILDVMTRLGSDAKLVLTYDLTQSDRPLQPGNSVQAVVDEFVGDPAVATIGFTKTQRSHIASLATTRLYSNL